MKQVIRTFIAVEIAENIRKIASQIIEQFRPAGADVGWVAPENLHLTVKFLGDVSVVEVPRVCQALRQAVGPIAPFSLEIRGAGAFPNLSRPRVIWLGAGQGHQDMARLADQVERALEPLGFRREGRPFQSHLTLGRVRRAGPGIPALARLIQQYADHRVGSMPVEQVVVFSSKLERTGAVYEALDRAQLAGT
ncbi:MAG: RNA 2',3'-cyclic phosphodiesterase [Thermoguttaceae bacterium]